MSTPKRPGDSRDSGTDSLREAAIVGLVLGLGFVAMVVLAWLTP